MACMRKCITTLAAFVWLSSAVNFQMSSQMTCLRGGIFTLVAFVSRPIIIKVISAVTNIHNFLQFDESFLAVFAQLTSKGEN